MHFKGHLGIKCHSKYNKVIRLLQYSSANNCWGTTGNEYKSIMEDNAKLQKETEYKQQKMIVRKLIKNSKMQHYHEALNNARKNPKDT